MVDALDSKSSTRESVRVRFPPPALQDCLSEVRMANWCKVVTTILVAGSLAFAQYDNDYDNDDPLASEEQSTEESSSEEESDDSEGYSYGGSKGSDKIGEADASGDEWEGFHYEEMGLTQWEFQQAKEEGVSRDKLTHLVEIGIRPSEYLQKPWNRLGVTEEQWLSQRSQGLEDADIDRSYRNHSGDQQYAYLSLLLPSLYQWKSDQSSKAIWMDALWVVGVGATVYMAVDGSSSWYYFLIPVVGAHIWSFADAFFGTQWANNPDANRFSFGILPTPDKGISSIFQVKF